MLEKVSEEVLSAVPVVIPAYEPDRSFVCFCKELTEVGYALVVVDDGSGAQYREIFDSIRAQNILVLEHEKNMGKGRALKAAFSYILQEFPEIIGAATADSDGQHTVFDIGKCIAAFAEHPNDLILGCRTFDGAGVPWKSRLGNELTKKAFRFLCGINLSDTQTGLRVIPGDFMRELLDTPGERFEFETNMLLKCKNSRNIREVEICTIYDSKTEHKTHFRPLHDSVRIYRTILLYAAVSFLCAFLDFALFHFLAQRTSNVWFITYLGRALSATANFVLNRKLVFRHKNAALPAFLKYAVLALVSGTASALLQKVINACLGKGLNLAVKAIVEAGLFFFNYVIQKRMVFAGTQERYTQKGK